MMKWWSYQEVYHPIEYEIRARIGGEIEIHTRNYSPFEVYRVVKNGQPLTTWTASPSGAWHDCYTLQDWLSIRHALLTQRWMCERGRRHALEMFRIGFRIWVERQRNSA